MEIIKFSQSLTEDSSVNIYFHIIKILKTTLDLFKIAFVDQILPQHFSADSLTFFNLTTTRENKAQWMGERHR